MFLNVEPNKTASRSVNNLSLQNPSTTLLVPGSSLTASRLEANHSNIHLSATSGLGVDLRNSTIFHTSMRNLRPNSALGNRNLQKSNSGLAASSLRLANISLQNGNGSKLNLYKSSSKLSQMNTSTLDVSGTDNLNELKNNQESISENSYESGIEKEEEEMDILEEEYEALKKMIPDLTENNLFSAKLEKEINKLTNADPLIKIKAMIEIGMLVYVGVNQIDVILYQDRIVIEYIKNILFDEKECYALRLQAAQTISSIIESSVILLDLFRRQFELETILISIILYGNDNEVELLILKDFASNTTIWENWGSNDAKTLLTVFELYEDL
ncbi:hypothetical protein HK099_005593 [Clydaea vesicula]|uniref:Uncharacterized protein n=1 Tax=Clydaea vesicula TaxID=447962 RepID=A0AAD5TZ20_9FUNG|nr:hypothetical protein HK099_005593 [Clydaea vesicula]